MNGFRGGSKQHLKQHSRSGCSTSRRGTVHYQDIALTLAFLPHEMIRSEEDFSTAFKPILGEGGLKMGNCVSFHFDHGVTPARMLAFILEPVISHTSSADKCGAAVDNQQFAMGSIIEVRKFVPLHAVVPDNISASLF